MIRLLKIELNKVLYNRSVWVIFGLHLLLLFLTVQTIDGIFESLSKNMGGAGGVGNSNQFSILSYPKIWHIIAYLFTWFQFFLAIIIILLVTGEYTYKTICQNIIDGMSKWEIVFAKELVIICFSLISVLLLIVSTLLLGVKTEGVSIFEGSSVVLAYFISITLYLNFVYFLSSLLKKSGLVIAMFIIYNITEKIISYKLPKDVAQYLPMNLIDSMIPNPYIDVIGGSTAINLSILNIGMSGFYIGLFMFLNYWMLEKGSMSK